MRYFIMRYPLTAICLVLSVLLTGSARAAEETPDSEDRAGRRAEMRQQLREEFDADGDGQLSDAERAAAREAMRSRRGSNAKVGKEKGARAAKGAKRAGAGRRGPGGLPDPARLFDEFDADGNGQLSRQEFMKLTAAVRAARPPRGPGQRLGARTDGPPTEARRRFDRDRPLQNPGDRPGPPPPPEARRRPLRDERGPDGPGARGPGRRGPEGWSAERWGPGGGGPPSPEQLFERFDEDGDDQLSREEFMKLADRMRELRELRERGGPGGERGAREGRRPRGGPPGEDGPPRRGRPQRPELDAPHSSGNSGAKPAASADDPV